MQWKNGFMKRPHNTNNLVTPPIFLKETIESQMEQALSHYGTNKKNNGYPKMSTILYICMRILYLRGSSNCSNM